MRPPSSLLRVAPRPENARPAGRDPSSLKPDIMRRLWLIFAGGTVSVAVLFTPTPSSRNGCARPRPRRWRSSRHLQGQCAGAMCRRRNSWPGTHGVRCQTVVRSSPARAVVQHHPPLGDPLFRHFFGERPDSAPSESGLGSGVIIVSPDGYAYSPTTTSSRTADAIEVALNDGRKFAARLVGRDPETDLCGAAHRRRRGASGDHLPGRRQPRGGDVVLAIGNFRRRPDGHHGHRLGARPQPARHQHRRELHPDRRRDQPGQLGWRAGRQRGSLVGINTAIYSRSGGSLGIGFCNPGLDRARRARADRRHRRGRARPGWAWRSRTHTRTGRPRSAIATPAARSSPAYCAATRQIGRACVRATFWSRSTASVRDPRAMLDMVAALSPGKRAVFRCSAAPRRSTSR